MEARAHALIGSGLRRPEPATNNASQGEEKRSEESCVIEQEKQRRKGATLGAQRGASYDCRVRDRAPALLAEGWGGRGERAGRQVGTWDVPTA